MAPKRNTYIYIYGHVDLGPSKIYFFLQILQGYIIVIRKTQAGRLRCLRDSHDAGHIFSWGLPKTRGTISGGPIIRVIIF